MFALIVDRHLVDPQDDLYSERLAIKNAALRAGASVEIRGSQPGKSALVDMLESRPGRHLVLQHAGDCGRLSEAEMDEVCRTRSARLVVYGGGVTSDCQPGESYARATVPTLMQNLEAFIRWLGEAQEIPGFEVLFGTSPQEAALCCLSALLPFGLLWEVAAKAAPSSLSDPTRLRDAAHALRGAQAGSVLEQAMREKLCALLGSPSHSDEAARKASFALSTLNRLLKESSASWKSGCGSECGPPESLDKALEILADSKSLDQWNARLRALRDTLLAEV